jgi:putative phosphoesterase
LKFGLTGDTHNNIKNIKDICDIFNSLSVDFVIHTGDISLPKSLEIFSNLNCPLHGVFGNNDEGDKADLIEVCREKNFDFSDGPKVMEKSGVKILIVHDPADIKGSDYYDFDVITHGHTHRFRDEKIENAFVFNPGECAGLMKGKNKIGIVSLHQISMDIIQF